MKKNNPEKLFKYTSLPILLDILQRGKLTLLDPDTWEDKNDSYFLQKYKEITGSSAVLATCFVRGSERYHYWKVFAGNISGVCIQFVKQALLSNFNDHPGVIKGNVIYRTIKQLQHNQPEIDILPFLKRYPYQDENEYRIIYKSNNANVTFKEFDIPITSIACIKLNPWMPSGTVQSVKTLIKSINGCSRLDISRTTVLENDGWKEIADRMFNNRFRPAGAREGRR